MKQKPPQPPLDVEIGDVWECLDGVTQVEITRIHLNSYYPIVGKRKADSKLERFMICGSYDEPYRIDDLDLVKIISRNGSPINHT